MALFPGALPVAGTAVSTDTLAAAGHTSLHNTDRDEIRAVATKIGTGSSTPTSATFLRGSGAGTSAWAAVTLTTDVTGVLPVANGGTGQNSLTALPLASPAITGTVSGSATYTTPTIPDFTNATHTHASTAQGGSLNGANAITDGSLTPAELVSGTGSSWAWQSWTPTLTSLSGGTMVAKYIQIGQTVFFRFKYTLAGAGLSGNPTFTLPITPEATLLTDNPFGGQAVLNDAGNNLYAATLTYNGSAALIRGIDSSTPNSSILNLSATVPFVWANTDVIAAMGFYEAA